MIHFIEAKEKFEFTCCSATAVKKSKYFSYLRFLSHRCILDVVGLEVSLQIENLQLILLGNGQQLAQRSISLNHLLLHQTLLLGIGADGSSYLATAHLSALGLVQEYTQCITDFAGLSEDTFLLHLLGAISSESSGLAIAATLASLLQLTRNALLQLLHLGENTGQSLAQGAHFAHQAVELCNHIDLLNSCLNGRCRGCNRLRYNNGCRCCNGRCCNGRGCNSGGLFLRGGLACGILSVSSSAHLISSPKEVYAHNKRTQTRFIFVPFWGKKQTNFGGAGKTFYILCIGFPTKTLSEKLFTY